MKNSRSKQEKLQPYIQGSFFAEKMCSKNRINEKNEKNLKIVDINLNEKSFNDCSKFKKIFNSNQDTMISKNFRIEKCEEMFSRKKMHFFKKKGKKQIN